MSDKELIEQELKSEILYRGRVLSLHKDEVLLPNGRITTREYIEHVGGAAILPIDQEGNVLLIRQFRYAYRSVIYEIPAGKLELGEDPLDAAKRELSEETGYTALTLREYGVFYPTPGYTNEKLYIYVAEDLHKSHVHLDEDEFVEVYRYPLEQVLHMIEAGEIQDGKTCYAVMRYAREQEKA